MPVPFRVISMVLTCTGAQCRPPWAVIDHATRDRQLCRYVAMASSEKEAIDVDARDRADRHADARQPRARKRAATTASTRDVGPGHQAMLHREQRGAGARRDADLAVGILDVAIGRLGGDPEPLRDLLGVQSASQQPDDFGFALGQAPGPLHARRLPARGLEDGADSIRVEAAVARLVA